MQYAKAAVINSAIGKASHTPDAPAALLIRNAAGIITTIYLERDMYREAVPFPSPSRVHDEFIYTYETMKPKLIT